MNPIAVLVYVPDVEAGLEWYEKAFPEATLRKVVSSEFYVLDINGFSLEIVQSDSKVGSGKKGTVLYWSVQSLPEAVSHLKSLGGTIYRGPMKIENNQSMCQVEDPFGNLIGLRGMSA